MHLPQNFKNEYWAVSIKHILSLVVVFSMASCQKACKLAPKDLDKQQDEQTTNLAFSVDKPSLQGDDKTLTITFKNQGKNAAKLNKFKLKATISEEEGGNGSELHYINATGVKETPTAIDTWLSHFVKSAELAAGSSEQVAFTIQTGQGVTKLKILVELYDEEQNQVVDTKPVTWTQKTPPTLEAVDLNDFTGTNPAQFVIKNRGMALVSSNDIQVKLTNTQGIAFSLGSKTGSTIECTLTELLGGNAVDIEPNKTTGYITLKLGAATTVTTSDISLQLFNKGETIPITTRNITWLAKDIKLSLTVTSPMALKGKSNNQIVLQVINNGEEDIVPGKLKLKVIRTEGFQAQLTEATGKDYELALPKLGGKGGKFDKTLVIDPNTDTKAEFELQLEYNGKLIESKKVTWEEDVDLILTLTQDPGKRQITYTVANKGSEQTAQEVKLWYKNSTTNKHHKAMLGGKKKAELILGKIGAGATVSDVLNVELDGEPHAIFEFEVRYAGTFQADKINIHGDKSVQLAFVDESEVKLKGGANNQMTFKIENKGKSASEKGKLKLQATRTKGNTAVITGAKEIAKGIYEVDLPDIELKPGVWSSEETLSIHPGKDAKAAFSLQLIYNGDEVSTAKQVNWEEDVQLIVLPLEYRKDANVILYQVSKTGADKPNQQLVLKYRNTDSTNKATLSNPNGSNVDAKKDKTEDEIALVIENPHLNLTGTGKRPLSINLNSQLNAEFEFKIFYGDECIHTKTLEIK